jgi:hypothetical protein
MDHDRDHYSASWDDFLLPVVAVHVGEAAAWMGREVRVAHQAQADTEQARAGVADVQEVVGHLVAAVEAALYGGGLARARIQTLEV